MADFVFIATIVAFFLLCVGYVSLCERIIGREDVSLVEVDAAAAVDDAVLDRAA